MTSNDLIRGIPSWTRGLILHQIVSGVQARGGWVLWDWLIVDVAIAAGIDPAQALDVMGVFVEDGELK